MGSGNTYSKEYVRDSARADRRFGTLFLMASRAEGRLSFLREGRLCVLRFFGAVEPAQRYQDRRGSEDGGRGMRDSRYLEVRSVNLEPSGVHADECDRQSSGDCG